MTDKNALRSRRCCFTGHRPEKLNISEEVVKELLKKAIKDAIDDGFVTFLSGVCRGIDLWAAKIVLEEKKKNANIRLICASPYEGFEARWSEADKELYRVVLSRADLVKYICKHYSRSCFQIRNVWMCDRASCVIAAYNGEPGGTKNTIDYAEKIGIEVINII